jgi:hypothetical protein
VLSVDQADEEEAKRKVAKFRDESNKCAFPSTMSGAARHHVSAGTTGIIVHGCTEHHLL